jgi:hydroxyacylglutathione hydrolase
MGGWQRVAADVWRLPGRGVDPNAYLLGDVLVDSASRLGRRRLLRCLAGSRLGAHVLSHVHPPTQGASRAVADRFGAQVWCGSGDAEALERGDARPWQPKSLVNDLQALLLAGPGVAPTRRLVEGDRVGDFTVIETPGHSPGHIALWRPDDKVLLAGDVVTAINVLTGRKGLHEPPRVFTLDPERNRRSAHRLAALGAETVLFSHGPPLYDGGRFGDFVGRLTPGLPA